jgi:hypothetical protein
MLTPDQIKRRAENKYQDFLRSLCATQGTFFPLDLFGSGLGKVDDYIGTSEQIAELKRCSRDNLGFGYLIEWQDRSFRRYGRQTVPSKVFFPTQNDFVKFLNKEEEVIAFESNYALLVGIFPEIREWALASPLRLARSQREWKELMAVCQHIRKHGRPNCYMRELPVAVDTKFIERNKIVLNDVLELVAPECVNGEADTFEERFGFRRKESMVRVKSLDDSVGISLAAEHFALPINSLHIALVNADTVLVVENEMTFLTLPRLPSTVALLGNGDAVANIGKAGKIGSRRIVYWGDLDVHGFEALSTLRIWCPQAESVMMDCATIRTFRHFCVNGAPTHSNQCERLTATENEAYSLVKSEGIMLEQERIPVPFATDKLLARIAITGTADLVSLGDDARNRAAKP